MKKQLYTFLTIVGFLAYVVSREVADIFKYYGDMLIIIGVAVGLIAVQWIPNSMQLGYILTLFFMGNISIILYAFKKGSFVNSLYIS